MIKKRIFLKANWKKKNRESTEDHLDNICIYMSGKYCVVVLIGNEKYVNNNPQHLYAFQQVLSNSQRAL